MHYMNQGEKGKITVEVEPVMNEAPTWFRFLGPAKTG